MMMLRTALLAMIMTTFALQVRASDVSADHTAAAQAYDRGTAAYLGGNYLQAAGWFETAHRLAPAAAALQQAARAYQRAGEDAHAASLALELKRMYPTQAESTAFAEEMLDALAPELLKVVVHCEACEITADDKVQPTSAFFLPADVSHTLSVTFATGTNTKQIRGAAGTEQTLTFEPPEHTDPQPATVATAQVNGSDLDAAPEPARPPFDPWTTWVAVGLTGALGVATALSGLDAIQAGHDYDDAITEWRQAGCSDALTSVAAETDCANRYRWAQQRFSAADDAESRTNLLLGVTAAVGLSAVLLAFFLTDWGDDEASGRSQAPMTLFSLNPLPGAGGPTGTLTVQF